MTKAVASILFYGLLAFQAANAQAPQSPVLKTIPYYTITNKTTAPQQIPLNLSTQNFGFFCRQELKMQKAHVPISFRLGTMEQCNRLEQKPGYR